MSTQTIQSSIFASLHADVAKRINLSSVILSVLFCLAGVTLFVLTLSLEDRSSATGLGLMVLGTGLILLAVFRFSWLSTKKVYLPTGSLVKEQVLFFDLKYLDDLKQLIDSGNFTLDLHFKSEVSGNIRLDVMLSEDHEFAAVQLFQFVPYHYQSVTPVRYYVGAEASQLASFLAASRVR